MAIISQETFDKFTEEEKKKVREYYESKEGIFPQYREALEVLFNKENLQPGPKIKTWKDVPLRGETLDVTIDDDGYHTISLKQTEFSEKIYKKLTATARIAKLIELGYGGMVTEEEWKDGNVEKVSIIYIPFKRECFDIYCNSHRKEFITFHTYKQAEEFMSYPENVKLVEQYYMI